MQFGPHGQRRDELGRRRLVGRFGGRFGRDDGGVGDFDGRRRRHRRWRRHRRRRRRGGEHHEPVPGGSGRSVPAQRTQPFDIPQRTEPSAKPGGHVRTDGVGRRRHGRRRLVGPGTVVAHLLLLQTVVALLQAVSRARTPVWPRNRRPETLFFLFVRFSLSLSSFCFTPTQTRVAQNGADEPTGTCILCYMGRLRNSFRGPV